MYKVRFTNGYWKLFNTVTYTAVAMFGLKREADEALARTQRK